MPKAHTKAQKLKRAERLKEFIAQRDAEEIDLLSHLVAAYEDLNRVGKQEVEVQPQIILTI